MSLDWDGMAGVEYECLACKKRFKGEELIFRDKLACPECGFKIIVKVRPPIVRRVKAV